MKSCYDPAFKYVQSKDMKPGYLLDKFREIWAQQEREKVESRLNRVIKIKRTA